MYLWQVLLLQMLGLGLSPMDCLAILAQVFGSSTREFVLLVFFCIFCQHNASAGGVGTSHPRTHAPKSVQFPRAPKDGKPPATTSAGATQQGHWRQPHVQGRQGQPQAPKTGIRAPHPDEKVAVAQERVSKLEAALRACGGRRRHSSQPQRGVEESPPTSRASVNSRQGCTMREFLGTGRKREAAARELLLQAQTELTRLSTEVVEGEQRLATPSSRVGAPPDSSCHSRHVRRGAEVACSSGTVVEGEGICLSPNRPEPQTGVSSGRFRPTVRRGDARVDPRPTEGSASGHRGRASLRSGEDLPTHVFSSTGVAADLPRTTFCDAIRSGEHGEVISPPYGMSCVGPRTG